MGLSLISKLYSEIISSASRIPYATLILVLITLQITFRKRGYYYHRYFVEVFILFLSGFNGLLASMVLPWLGLESYINCVAGRTCYYSTKYLLGITVQIDGLENYNPEEPCVLVTNHQTLVDIAIFGAFCGKGCVTVPKKSLKKIPIFGWYLTRGQSVWIDRGSQEKTLATMAQAAIDINTKKISPYLFPEGTRRNDNDYDFLPFKKGAFHLAKQANVPILPVVIGNYHNIVSTKEKYFKSGTIQVKILSPIYLDNIENNRDGINQTTDNVRNLMLKEYRHMGAVSKKTE